MSLPWEFVELLETHAEISIRGNVALKRFTLVIRSLGDPNGVRWLPLTLEPGQQMVRCTCSLMPLSDPGMEWLGIPGLPKGTRSEISFETVEHLRPEGRLFRVETFNAFLSQESVRLARDRKRVV